MFKNVLIWLISSQVFVFLLSTIIYHSIDLLAYINVSFVVGSILILLSLTGFIINKGFFDIIFASFQHTFSRVTEKDRRPLSELITFKYHLPFITGMITIVIMLGALLMYYR